MFDNIIIGDGIMKLVSVIVPVYNRCSVIEKCYISLINQLYSNIEIIFVDDGSTDDSLLIMNNFNDKRVKVITQKNKGPMEARKFGLENSYGEYILFVDSDDRLDKDYIYKLVNSIEKTNSNMAIGRLGVHYYYPLLKEIVLKAKKRPKRIDLYKNKEYLTSLTPGMVGKLFKRELLDLGEYNLLANEDIVIMYPLYIKCRYISIVNDTIYHYYLSENSQFKEYLLGYSFNNLCNTFIPLGYIYDSFKEMDVLEDYFYELEMVFIKNISERIWNIIQCVDDKIYRYKFISCLLDYLEYYFPDWNVNPYYVRGFKLGEVSDIYHIKVASEIVSKIRRKKLDIDLDMIYDRYKKIEEMYNKIK